MLIGQWWAYVFVFLWMGRGHCLLNILGHEAAHRLLFTWRWLNDGVGKWLLGVPDVPGRSPPTGAAHFAHHKDEMGPEEPDLALYYGYPIPPDSMRRKLTRDASSSRATRTWPASAGGRAREEPRGAVHRRGAGGAVRHLHRGRAVVGVPGDLGRAVDDGLEVQQPAARDRRARGDDAIEDGGSPRTSCARPPRPL